MDVSATGEMVKRCAEVAPQKKFMTYRGKGGNSLVASSHLKEKDWQHAKKKKENRPSQQT